MSAQIANRGFKIGLAQTRVEGGKPLENGVRAVAAIEAAAVRGAKVVVLPEALNLGWTHPSAGRLAEVVPQGNVCRLLRQAAREHRVYVCAGLVESEEEKTYNTAVFFGPDGSLLLRHRKINELEIGHPYYDLGSEIKVVETPLATFGVLICSDAFAPGQALTRSLGLMGAEVILSPCAWAVPGDHDNDDDPYGKLWHECYGPVARDFRMWIAGVSSVGWMDAGPWAGRKCIGCSLLMNPDGMAAVSGPYGEDAEAVMVAEIQLGRRPARGNGWAEVLAQSDRAPMSPFHSAIPRSGLPV